MADFEWTDDRRLAAELVARGELSVGRVAAQVGVTERTLYEWRKAPEFEARVEELVTAILAACRRRAVGHAERRVERLNRDWLRLQQVIEERAEAPGMQVVPGGRTGLLCHFRKPVKVGDGVEWLDVYEFDAALSKELREVEKQAAQELGQWTEKVDHTTAGHLTVHYVNDWRAVGTGDQAALPPPGSGGGPEAGEAV